VTVADVAILKEEWTRLVTGLIAVSPHLSQPYPDDPRWTPWTRFLEKEIDDMDDAVGALVRAARTEEQG
jgi:hypothetical protein